MLKRIFIVYILSLFTQKSIAQFDTAAVKQNILRQSDSMFITLKNKDWNSFFDYMHPTIIKKAIDKQAFLKLMKIGQLKNFTFSDHRQTGNVQIIVAGKTLQCVVCYGFEMHMDSIVTSGIITSIGKVQTMELPGNLQEATAPL